MPLTPQQRYLVRDAAARPGGCHVGQFVWLSHGPLDPARFTAAWRSVVACESVLRTAVEWPPEDEPRIVVHDHAEPEVSHHRAGTAADFAALRDRERLRPFDPHRPGPLRLALVDGPGAAGPRVLLTFDHILLDGYSVVLLLHQFLRAYLAGGRLPGGERRPDFADYAEWLRDRSTAAAREFWTGALPPTARTALPTASSAAARGGRRGRPEVRLSAEEAERLRAYGAEHAVGEAALLQAAWALLLHDAGDRTPAPVGLGAAVPGRSIPLRGVERVPGRLLNVLPLTVRVDPADTVEALLEQLRDWALDTAAYEWVAADQIRRWTGRPPHEPLFESQVVHLGRLPRMPAGLRTALAGRDLPGTLEPGGPPSPVPALFAHGAPDGGLVLTLRHDRARLTDAEASWLVARCARILRALCRAPAGTMVGRLLDRAA